MKSLSKNITKIFLSIIIFCNLFFVSGVSFTYAADKNINDECAPGVDKCLIGSCLQDMASTYRCLEYAPQVYIPGITYSLPKGSTKQLGEYVKGLYNYAVGITAIVATVVLMIGGLQWIVAGGSGEKISEAKAWITAALSGLVLALSSYMILNLVNPNLVNLKIDSIKNISAIKPKPLCCYNGDGSPSTTVKDFDSSGKIIGEKCNLESVECDKYCSGKYGDGCSNNGYCYNGKCLLTDGKEGEPCGLNMAGKCLPANITGIIVTGGRNCGPDLYCTFEL